jgi:CheY-like chemotaxis protein
VESQSNRKFEGTGLGLAITQRLIERMEGAVWVDSEMGKGSCFGFRLSLPIAEDAPVVRRPIHIKRALVVDDQFINRTILERQLVPCGIAVTLCRSGAEALEALAAGSFDVVITDHDMPEMDGLQLASRIRAAGNLVPLVLLSSSPANAREARGPNIWRPSCKSRSCAPIFTVTCRRSPVIWPKSLRPPPPPPRRRVRCARCGC